MARAKSIVGAILWVGSGILLALIAAPRLGLRSAPEPLPDPMVGDVRADAKVISHLIGLDETVSGPRGTGPGMKKLFALRSDGSHVMRREYSEGPLVTITRMMEFSDGSSFVTDDVHELFAKRDWIPTLRLLPDPATDCVESFSGYPLRRVATRLADEVVDGRRAVVFQQRDFKLFLAPEVGCSLVKQVAVWDSDRSDFITTQLSFGEPPGALFEIPQRYQEVPMETLIKALSGKALALNE